MYLLDTNVVSEIRKRRPHVGAMNWIRSVSPLGLYVCAVTVAEIQAGIEITREQDAAKAAELEAWLEEMITVFPVLPMDTQSFRIWARLMHRRSQTLYEDAMIAAIATANRLTIASRKVADFRALGVSVINPFSSRDTTPPRAFP